MATSANDYREPPDPSPPGSASVAVWLLVALFVLFALIAAILPERFSGPNTAALTEQTEPAQTAP
jgi:hypothetical protein